MRKRFGFYFVFTSWASIQAGFHIHVGMPNIEVHIPFGFIRIGWVQVPSGPVIFVGGKRKIWGLDPYRDVEFV